MYNIHVSYLYRFYGKYIVVLYFAVSAYSYKRQVRPTFLDTGRRNITVAKGGLAELRCRIRNLGPKEVGKLSSCT